MQGPAVATLTTPNACCSGNVLVQSLAEGTNLCQEACSVLTKEQEPLLQLARTLPPKRFANRFVAFERL